MVAKIATELDLIMEHKISAKRFGIYKLPIIIDNNLL